MLRHIREQGHALSMEDLREVLDDLPERLIVGTGASGRMRPNPDAMEELRARGIHVEALPTDLTVRRRAVSTLTEQPDKLVVAKRSARGHLVVQLAR